MCAEQKEKLRLVAEQMKPLADHKLNNLHSIIYEIQAGYSYQDRKPWVDFLQATRVALASKALAPGRRAADLPPAGGCG